MPKKQFDSERSGTGTNEWAEVTENISRGCINDCRYCYAAQNANRFKRKARADWHNEELTKRADIKRYPQKDGIIMIPSSHDITEFNLDAFIRVTTLMLESGNRLLIVSKPRINCIVKIMDKLEKYKSNILFRFTIGSIHTVDCLFWEPGAPTPHERRNCLTLAFDRKFKTSVSAEPLLGGIDTAMELYWQLRHSVTDSIWIGKMNKIRLRVNMDDIAVRRNVEIIEKEQTDIKILEMYDKMKDFDKIKWKDSIKNVVAERNS